MKRSLHRLFWIWFAIGFAFTIFIEKGLSGPPFYTTLLMVSVGIWVLRYPDVVAARLARISLTPFKKFLVLGYGMVLLEEVFAALTNNLKEGFALPLLAIRIGQFWAFNIFAFTGLILGWYWLYTRIAYSRTEAFFLVGAFGLYTERVISALPEQIHAFLIFAPLTIAVYGIIFAPAILSLGERNGRRVLPAIVRYALAGAVPFAAGIVPVLILWMLRMNFPWAFPPCNFIPCT